MADTSNDLVTLSVQLAQTAMGDKGGWINNAEDIKKFVSTIHATLVALRYPPQQSR